MTTSPTSSTVRQDHLLRLVLREADDYVHGAWWPHSRYLGVEAARLVDEFPPASGRIGRLLFSRPDWDDAESSPGKGRRWIQARRGRVKTGSFPSDDTHLMVLVLSGGRRMRLVVLPSTLPEAEGRRQLASIAEHGVVDGDDVAWARWDDATAARAD